MIKLDGQGLVPAVVQDAHTKDVLMVGYMNPESLRRTVETGDIWFYSRSRGELWHKGDTSGNYLRLHAIHEDCDGDALLMEAAPAGPTCHTGNTTCFFRALESNPEFTAREDGPGILQQLHGLIQERKRTQPADSYTTKLLQQGISRIAQKVIEEAGETGLAAATGKTQDLPEEAADLLFHLLVMLAAADVSPEQVWEELRSRRQGKQPR